MGNKEYLSGQLVNITDIGEQPTDRADPGSTLVCVTTNVNMDCCRSRDRSDNAGIGHWYYPNGTTVNSGSSGRGQNFTRYLYRHQVRLASQGVPEGPLGVYTCEIPDGNGRNIAANINIINVLSGKLNFYPIKYKISMHMLDFSKGFN